MCFQPKGTSRFNLIDLDLAGRSHNDNCPTIVRYVRTTNRIQNVRKKCSCRQIYSRQRFSLRASDKHPDHLISRNGRCINGEDLDQWQGNPVLRDFSCRIKNQKTLSVNRGEDSQLVAVVTIRQPTQIRSLQNNGRFLNPCSGRLAQSMNRRAVGQHSGKFSTYRIPVKVCVAPSELLHTHIGHQSLNVSYQPRKREDREQQIAERHLSNLTELSLMVNLFTRQRRRLQIAVLTNNASEPNSALKRFLHFSPGRLKDA